MGWLVSYAKYDEIVALGVQTTYSVVSNDVKNPLVFATNLITFSTPPTDLACSILKLIAFNMFLTDLHPTTYLVGRLCNTSHRFGSLSQFFQHLPSICHTFASSSSQPRPSLPLPPSSSLLPPRPPSQSYPELVRPWARLPLVDILPPVVSPILDGPRYSKYWMSLDSQYWLSPYSQYWMPSYSLYWDREWWDR